MNCSDEFYVCKKKNTGLKRGSCCSTLSVRHHFKTFLWSELFNEREVTYSKCHLNCTYILPSTMPVLKGRQRLILQIIFILHCYVDDDATGLIVRNLRQSCSRKFPKLSLLGQHHETENSVNFHKGRRTHPILFRTQESRWMVFFQGQTSPRMLVLLLVSVNPRKQLNAFLFAVTSTHCSQDTCRI